jgi:hypothetical protein
MRDRFHDPPRERLPEMKNENTTVAGFPVNYGAGSSHLFITYEQAKSGKSAG